LHRDPISQWKTLSFRQGFQMPRQLIIQRNGEVTHKGKEGLIKGYGERILPVTLAIAERWGVLNAGNPIPYLDGFLAATAIEHGLALATRNVDDIRTTGVSFVNPFAIQAPP